MKPNKPQYTQRSGFKVPEDYFRNLEENLMQKISEEEFELPGTSSGFSVPEGYFDSLEDNVLKKATQPETRIVQLFRKEYLYYAAAVAAIFVLMLGNFFKPDHKNTYGWEDIDITAMEDYIDEGYNMGYVEWNTAEYSDVIFNSAEIINEEDFNSVDSEAVLDYLDENIEDPTYILE